MTKIKTWDGGKAGSATVDAKPLGEQEQVKKRLLWAAVRMYEANKRQGTVKTKTRAEIKATTRKPYRQKGTGNARRGDYKSPLLRGGGVIFGPRPRDYSYHMPRKALREALRTALAGKLNDEEVVGLSSKGFDAPSTRSAAAALAGLGCESSTVVVLPAPNETMWKSFRNLRRVSVLPASDLNCYDVLAHDRVVLVDDAWDALMKRIGHEADEKKAAAKPAPKAKAKAAPKAKAEAKPEPEAEPASDDAPAADGDGDGEAS